MADGPQWGIHSVYLLQVNWAAQYNTWLLIELTLKGVVLSFSFLFLQVSWLQSLPACDGFSSRCACTCHYASIRPLQHHQSRVTMQPDEITSTDTRVHVAPCSSLFLLFGGFSSCVQI